MTTTFRVIAPDERQPKTASIGSHDPERVALALLGKGERIVAHRVAFGSVFGIDLKDVTPCGLCGGSFPPSGFALYAYDGNHWRYIHTGCAKEAAAWITEVVCPGCNALMDREAHTGGCTEANDLPPARGFVPETAR